MNSRTSSPSSQGMGVSRHSASPRDDVDGGDGDFHRILADVVNIFTEVTGLKLDSQREAQTIRHWVNRGWKAYEFRLLIEYQFHHPKTRAWFDEAIGRMNLRHMFNPSRESWLTDALSELKHKDALQKKIKESEESKISAVNISRLKMKCGALVRVFKMNGSSDKSEYDEHLSFDEKGKPRCLKGCW